MTIQPRYPNVTNDPRLTCVASEVRKLRRQISDAEWQGKNVTNSQRDKFLTLKEQMNDGKLYTPKF